MDSKFIDRRLNGKNKSLPNRERFIRRYKSQLQKVVERKTLNTSIKDLSEVDKLKVRVKTTEEPSFRYGQGGDIDRVHHGNKEYVVGDELEKPSGQSGSPGNSAGEGDSEENFEFVLSKDEFLRLYFQDLELPNLLKKDLHQVEQFKLQNAGYTKSGSPQQLSIVKTMKGALARKIALSAKTKEELDLEEEIAKAVVCGADVSVQKKRLDQLIALRLNVPFLDEIDLRFKARTPVAAPASNALMFCVMDVSASMGEHHKNLAKRFFMLLYTFLKTKYKKVEVVFISHTDTAMEVDEYAFFHGYRSGGTEVKPSFELVSKIIEARYSPDNWNMYMAYSSDGDATDSDSLQCANYLSYDLLTKLQFFTYLEVHDTKELSKFRKSQMLQSFETLSKSLPVRACRIAQASEVYPAFRELFRK